MAKTLVSVGDQYGTLTVIRLDGVWAANGKKRTAGALCRCSCGAETPPIALNKLKRTRSCRACADKTAGAHRRTHGHTVGGRTPEYIAWKAMRTRCSNNKQQHAGCYVGRGITYCARWESFENFLADMGPKPSPKHSLDRIDNEAGYSPENCRWATQQTQMNNTRRSRRITFNGETLTVAEWARRLGLHYKALYSRLFVYGWSVERALSEDCAHCCTISE